VVYTLQDDDTGFDIWAAPVGGDGEPRVVRAQPGIDVPGGVSPDGRWLTYFSDESGTMEVYITPFPDASRRWQVSTASGIYPFWCRGGRELVYQQLDGRLMSVEVELGEDSVRLGESTPLFDIAPAEPTGPAFAPSADGQQFLVIPKGEATETTLLNLVVGWPQVLEVR
jgi:Tol biopolymer transport system component